MSRLPWPEAKRALATLAEKPAPGQPVSRAWVLGRLAPVLLGIALGIAAVDRGLAWYDAAKVVEARGMLLWDEELGWTNRPGFENERTRISSLGLRSPEIPAGADPREVRVLGVGASRVFGAGEGCAVMSETWSAFLEGLAQRYFGPWRVLNGGVMGYSVMQAARRAAKLQGDLDPDLVLVFASPGSQSLIDVSSARNFERLPSGRLIPADLAAALPGWLHDLAARAHGRMLESSAIYARYRSRFTDEGKRDRSIDKFVLSRAPRPTEVEAAYRATLAELERLARALVPRAELRVVLLLDPYQDQEERWSEHLRNYAGSGAPPPGTPRLEPLEVMEEDLARLGIRCWSLASAITKMGSDRGLYTCDGTHWTVAGHRLVALALQDLIRTDGLDRSLAERRAAGPRR